MAAYRPLEVVEPFDPDAMVRVPWTLILDDQRLGHLAGLRASVPAHLHTIMLPVAGHEP